MKRIRVALSGILLVIAGLPGLSEAVPIVGTGKDGLGAFTGSFTYDPVTSQLIMELDNVSPVTHEFITGLALNNPGGIITAVSLTDDDAALSWNLLGGLGFANGIDASPFGRFDIGAATGNSWLGGGPASAGISVTDPPVTFTFTLTCGAGLCGGSLSTAAFLSDLSVPIGNHAGEFFAVRFRAIAGNSDKAPGTVVPEPGTLFLLGSGLVFGLGFLTRKRWAKSRS